jgi:hypothetical protein
MERRFHRGFTAAEKTELWDRWKRGESLKAIGRAFGKESSSIYFLVAPHGGIRPAERRRSRLALTEAEGGTAPEGYRNLSRHDLHRLCKLDDRSRRQGSLRKTHGRPCNLAEFNRSRHRLCDRAAGRCRRRQHCYTTNGPGLRAGFTRFVAPSTTALLQDFVGWKADVSVAAVARVVSDAMWPSKATSTFRPVNYLVR